MIRRLAALTLLSGLLAVQGAHPPVAEGDLIARNRGGPWSHYFANVSPTDKRFSHVGLVVLEDGIAWVIHSKGDDANGEGHVHRETLVDFVADTDVWAHFRCELPEVQRLALARQVRVFLKRRVPFDAAFDHTEAHRLYCTELIWRAAMEAIDLDLCPRKTPLGPHTVLSIQDLTDTPYFTEVPGRGAVETAPGPALPLSVGPPESP
ncbi:MAG: hypothetical protein ACFB20_09000 [Opitutales bacterium]